MSMVSTVDSSECSAGGVSMSLGGREGGETRVL
jgi:hypothetical protein